MWSLATILATSFWDNELKQLKGVTMAKKSYSLKRLLFIALIVAVGFFIIYTMINFDDAKRGFKEGWGSGANINKETKNRIAHFNEYFQQRSKEDLKSFTKDQLRNIENNYQIANKNFGSDKAIETLKKLVNDEEYEGANRIGCALLYLGQMSEGDEQEKYLLAAKNDYSNSWYGDGVNVGAYAAFKLYYYYSYNNDIANAKKLKTELVEKYPNYIDHKGNLLSDIIM